MRHLLASSWLCAVLAAGVAHAQGDTALDLKIRGIMSHAGFQNAHWGMEFFSPDSGKILYALNVDQLFNPASSMKVFLEATALATLGPDYRFHTRVYRTGPIKDGVLHGDLVLVASGDLLISGRLKPDGTLALPEPDHSYDFGGSAVPAPGNPLEVIRDIARQIAAHGIKRVQGRVLVDDSLFRQASSSLGGGSPTAMSPMMINDNLIDITVTPGSHPGAPATLHISPETAYLQVTNEVNTIAADAATSAHRLNFVDDVAKPDGTHDVKLTGDIPQGSAGLFRAYRVPEPAQFAEIALAQALNDVGVAAKMGPAQKADFKALASHYTSADQVAEHVSPPLPEEMEVMTKVSSNIHTGMIPYLVGAIAGHEHEDAKAAGDRLRFELYEKAGLSPKGPGIGLDTKGFGIGGEKYSPEFFVKFLSYMSRQSYFPIYRQAMPIMGKDGTLAQIQPNSPAAGHVFAKTGGGIMNFGGAPQIVRALAGYMEPPGGQRIVFAEFTDFEASSPAMGFQAMDHALETLGEIASAVYEFATSNH